MYTSNKWTPRQKREMQREYDLDLRISEEEEEQLIEELELEFTEEDIKTHGLSFITLLEEEDKKRDFLVQLVSSNKLQVYADEFINQNQTK